MFTLSVSHALSLKMDKEFSTCFIWTVTLVLNPTKIHIRHDFGYFHSDVRSWVSKQARSSCNPFAYYIISHHPSQYLCNKSENFLYFIQEERTFSEVEEERLQTAFSISAPELELVLETLEFILQQVKLIPSYLLFQVDYNWHFSYYFEDFLYDNDLKRSVVIKICKT